MQDTIYLVMNHAGVKGYRKTRPKLNAGEVAVRVCIEVSERFFERAIPTVTVTVPDEYVVEPQIGVELMED